MKYKIINTISAVLLLVSMTSFSQGKITVSGSIKGYQGEDVFIVKDAYDEQGKDLNLKVSKDGSFKTEFASAKPLYDANLYIDQTSYKLYFKPGGKYNITVDITDKEDDSKYAVSGSNAKENLLIKNYVNKLQKHYLITEKLHSFETYAPYSSFINSIVDPLNKELLDTKNPGFIANYKTKIKQEWLFNNFLYEFTAKEKIVKNNGDVSIYKGDAQYDAFLKSTAWTSTDSKLFTNIGQSFIFFLMGPYKDIDMIEILKTLNKVVPHQSARNGMATMIMKDFYSRGGTGDLDASFDFYKKICTDVSSVAAIDKERMRAKALRKGAMAMDFEMKDSSGKVFKLSDFKGKAVYIDVWATWCAPCIKETPHFKKLVEKYKGDNRIEFISVSVDSDKNAWNKMITKDSHDWKQLIVDNNLKSDLCVNYGIEMIPRFLLFDKEGRVVNATAPHPSDSESIIEEINGIL
ncbi:TlpA family protein disulfide reductase [Flavobacterium pectinovorum]|uniref:TlpA family protein disulfide reductase n=1 Tax=Flavobacterium pectinovorum TaxID=29533 RepID=UPI001FACBA45|nr:TlpA disulfide reductase family protein [Flavobacterium pectinovorum]MCI9846848.1 redoxin family protein [Flavobacterium pectinovorum]